MAFIFLFGSMLIVMLLRIAPPIGVRIDGEPIGKVTLGMRERVRLQRTNVYAIGAMMLVTAFTGDIPLILELAVMVGVLAILAIPVRYVLTARGVALNRTVFRQWTDFQDLEVDAGGIKLMPVPGVRAFRLVLSPDKARDVARSISRLLTATSTKPPLHRRRRAMASAHS